ncbi:hypothetical protein K438DRAFT_1617545, partial [Mycena galopus ATCC 62051]
EIFHGHRGTCDINKGIHCDQNRRLVLHDSRGFEPGQDENLNKAQEFLEARSREDVPLAARVHCVWCALNCSFRH